MIERCAYRAYCSWILAIAPTRERPPHKICCRDDSAATLSTPPSNLNAPGRVRRQHPDAQNQKRSGDRPKRQTSK